MRFIFFIFITATFSWYSYGNADTSDYTFKVDLNEVVISSFSDSFGVNDLISIIQSDTTFYKAFKSLRLTTFNGLHDIKVLDKKKRGIVARYTSETKQIYREGCRRMNTLEEKVEGKFYDKKGDYIFFTAQLYDELFFTKGVVCGENNIVKGSLEEDIRGKDRIGKSKVQLKHLIFNPGHPIAGLPGIGNKVGIFQPNVAEKYDFKIEIVHKNGERCYLFTAIPKLKYQSSMVIQSWKTWLKVSDLSMIARDYHLKYNATIYDFDVKMYVELKEHLGVLLPSLIHYDGNWHLATQKREIVQFEGRFYY